MLVLPIIWYDGWKNIKLILLKVHLQIDITANIVSILRNFLIL